MVVKVYQKRDISHKFDTEQTLKEKIAMELGSIPRYIKFLPSDDEDTIVVDDILNDIYEKEFDANFDLQTLINENPSIDILNVWLSSVKFSNNMVDYKFNLLEDFLDRIDIKVNLEVFYRTEAEAVIKTLLNDIELNKQKVITREKMMTSFNKITNEVERTELEVEKTLFELKLDIPITSSIMEVFNEIQTSSNVPFVGYKNYYKIYKSLPNAKGWEKIPIPSLSLRKQLEEEEIESENTLEEQTSNIKVCILKRKNQPSAEQSERIDVKNYYSIATIELREDDGYYMLIDHEVLPSNVSNEELIERAVSIIENMDIVDKKILKLSGTFDIKNQSLDSNIFSDLVMNHPAFNVFLSIKENIQTEKGRYTIQYNHPFYGSCVVILSQKVVSRQLAGQKAIAENVVRIKVRNGNMNTVAECTSAFSKFFYIYEAEKKGIIDFYKKYIPNFTEKKIDIQSANVGELKLNDIVPDLFVGGISRSCEKFPKIVEREEALAKGEGRYMIYPKTADEGPQHYYICEDENLVPSLTNNKLSKKYKELPCCHQNHNTVYNKYYGIIGEEDVGDKVELKYQRIISTKKFLNPGQIGVLPDNLKSMFLFFDGYKNRNFGRSGLGIKGSKSSFLECVMKALKIGIFDTDEILSDAEIDLEIRNERKRLAEKAISTGICFQEYYDQSVDEMYKNISDENIYLDPRKNVRLLEEEYQCKIYIFSRKDVDGFMVIPDNIHGHLYYKNKWEKTIILFDHNGSESDHAQYNRCELVTRWNADNFSDNNTIVFDTKEQFIELIDGLYKELSKTYIGNDHIKPFVLPKNLNIDSQGFDPYGKCRFLNVKFNNTKIHLFCSPIPPLNIKKVDKIIIDNPVPIELAIKFAAEYNMAVLSVSLYNDMAVEINLMYQQIKFTIPIIPSDPPNGIPIRTDLAYPHDLSVIQKFTQNRRVARYITQYVFWMFSNYCFDKGIKEPNSKDIKNFIKDNVLVYKRFVYGNISRKFTLDDTSGLTKNSKLVITSQDMAKKLIYAIELKIIQNIQSLLTYRNKKYIADYYDAISDFDYNPKQIILNEGVISFYTWSNYRYTDYKIYDNVQDNEAVYFFMRDEVNNGKIQLVKNMDSFDKAVIVSQEWNKKGIIVTPDKKQKPNQDISGLSYFYIRPNNEIIEFETGNDEPEVKLVASSTSRYVGSMIDLFV